MKIITFSKCQPYWNTNHEFIVIAEDADSAVKEIEKQCHRQMIEGDLRDPEDWCCTETDLEPGIIHTGWYGDDH